MLRPLHKFVFDVLVAIAVLAALSATARAQFCDPWFGCFGGEGIVDVSVATDQPSYTVGDPITYSVTAHNPASTPVTLNFTTSHQAGFTVDGVYSLPDVALQVLTSRSVPAHGTVSWDFLHPWSAYPLAPELHSVIGEVVGYGFSSPATYLVMPPAPVTQDVFIDFETYPNGTPTHDGNQLTRGLDANAFVGYGVHFSSEGGSVNLRLENDGALLHTPTTSYPPGFNIIAEFEMPVYSVSADVGSAADRTITMFAYDADGQTLGSVSSDPVTNYPNLVGPLSFDSPVPIASVQWFSSSTNASVRLDNLFLNVDLAETRGDFNADGQTDAADYTLWRSSLGQTVPIGSSADANHNGVVDVDDYTIWRTHFGSQGVALYAPPAVPEPSAAALLAALALAASAPPRKHRR